MGRSYSEYPFHEQQPMLSAQGSGPRLGNDEDKQKIAQQKASLPDAPITFRQPHAETLQRLKQRRAAKKAAGGDSARGGRRATAKKATPAAKKAAPAKKAATAKKAAPAAKKAAPMRKAEPMQKASAPSKGSEKRGGLVAKLPMRGGKTVARLAAAAKKVTSRLTRKSTKAR